jgi:hypothetical protein
MVKTINLQTDQSMNDQLIYLLNFVILLFKKLRVPPVRLPLFVSVAESG